MIFGIFLLAIFSVNFTENCATQRKDNQDQDLNCPADTSCILLIKCPAAVALVLSRERGNMQQAKESICDFQGVHPKVCCKHQQNTTEEEETTVPVLSTIAKMLTTSKVVEETTVPGLSTIAKMLTSRVVELTNTTTSIPPTSEEMNLLPLNCGKPFYISDRIVGGKNATRGEYPWMVAMGYQDGQNENLEFLCSGTLINNRYVLTAAHCLHERMITNRKLKVLHLGDFDLSMEKDCKPTIIGEDCFPPHVVVGIEREILHPQYDPPSVLNDIALIRMDVVVEFTPEIQPLCLPFRNLDVERAVGNRTLIAAGWGRTENASSSDILLKIALPLQDPEKCKTLYKSRFQDKQLCVGGEKEKDTCVGDSGGPLFINGPKGPPFLLLGIVSFGPAKCGLENFPAVYTSASSYKTWIDQNLRP